MNIKFLNGTNFEYLEAVETEEFYNGSSRRTLTFECAGDAVSIDELNTVLSDEANTQTIQLSGDEITNFYDGYVLKLKCGVENRRIQAETPETAAVYADRLIFKLGKRTYIEEQLRQLGL